MSVFGNIGAAIKKAAGDTERAVVKGAVDTGHAVGAAANNPLVQTVALGALAATGAGAAVEVGAGTLLSTAGQVLKKGGGSKNLPGAILGGAARGAAVATVAAGIRNASQIGSVVQRVTSRGASAVADAGSKIFDTVTANPRTAGALSATGAAVAVAKGTKSGLPGSTGAHTATDTTQGDHSSPTETNGGGDGGNGGGGGGGGGSPDTGGGGGGGGSQAQGSPDASGTPGKSNTMLYVLGAVALGAGVLFLSPRRS